MATWLDRVRNKPKMVRKQYAFAGASVVTGLIVLVWLLAAPFSNDLEGPTLVTEKTSTGAFAQFVSNVKEQLSASVATFGAVTDLDKAENAPVTASDKEATTPVNIPQLSATNTAVRQVRARPILIATSSSGTTTVNE